MKTLIISGGRFDYDFAVSFLKTHSYDYVIAVDHGERYAKALGITPDMLVGDFDTRGKEGLKEYEEIGVTVRTSIPEKDDTDTEMAIREAVRLKSDMDILCATGGRIDHLLGNIHNLKIAMDAGYEARLIDAGNILFLKNHDFTMKKEDYPGKYISFVPFDGAVTGMRLSGFKYNVYDFTLSPGASRCISNEFAPDTKEAFVSFHEGCLIVINSSDVKTE